MRQATRHDKDQIKFLLRCFRDESDFKQLQNIEDNKSLDQLIDSILVGAGVCYIEDGKGLLIAALCPSIWDNRIMLMHELAWYVLPEHRGTSIGLKLFLAYKQYGEQLKQEGRIQYFTLSKYDRSPNLNYEKRGFVKKDENWVC